MLPFSDVVIDIFKLNFIQPNGGPGIIVGSNSRFKQYGLFCVAFISVFYHFLVTSTSSSVLCGLCYVI